MKFVLIALIVKDLAITSPWATSTSAEFNTRAACQEAADRLLALAKKLQTQGFASCFEKGADGQ